MRNFIKKLTRNKILFSIMFLMFITITASSIYLIYSIKLLNNIENLLRLIGSILLGITWLTLSTLMLKSLVKNKKLMSVVLIVVSLLYSGTAFFIGHNINEIFERLNNVSSSYTTYSTSIVTLNSNKAESINDLGDSKIGILNDETSIDGYQIPQEIIKNNNLKNELVMYDSFITLLQDLLSGEIDFIFISSNYNVLFGNVEEFVGDLSETKVIYTQDKNVSKSNVSSNRQVTEPFTLLIMGVDSEIENISGSSFNGDALMLITFNPKTLSATMLSIPRDTYVPITCFSGQRKNKITHAAWYGEECMMDTIENFTGIEIDYYVKINFKGVVKLVDAVGGIEVDVPYSFCEQDSSRRFGKNTIYVEKGFQTLNGEQALAFSRNRHTNSQYCKDKWTYGDRSDFVRNANQQLVISGLLNKFKSINSLDQIYSILDTISNSMETNMSTDEILSFYNIGKDILLKSKNNSTSSLIGFQKLYLKTYGQYIYDYSSINNQGMRLNLSTQVPYKGSINDIVSAMKVNLGLESPKMIKSINFDINSPYEEIVIGKSYYNESSIELLPSFIGSDKSVAINYGSKHGIKVNVEYITSIDPNTKVGQITDQSLPKNMDIEYISKSKGITITVIEKVTPPITEFDYSTCSLEENKENSNCLFKNFVGKDISEFISYKNKIKLSIIFNTIEIKKDDEGYDEKNIGKIINQNVDANTPLFDLLNKTITIKYISKETSQDSTENGNNDSVLDDFINDSTQDGDTDTN